MALPHDFVVLSKSDCAIVVITVAAAWFFPSLLHYRDVFVALGSTLWGIALGFALIGSLNKRRRNRASKVA